MYKKCHNQNCPFIVTDKKRQNKVSKMPLLTASLGSSELMNIDSHSELSRHANTPVTQSGLVRQRLGLGGQGWLSINEEGCHYCMALLPCGLDPVILSFVVATHNHSHQSQPTYTRCNKQYRSTVNFWLKEFHWSFWLKKDMLNK